MLDFPYGIPQSAHLQLLQERLLEFLQLIREHLSPALAEDLGRVLHGPGKLLSFSPNTKPQSETWATIPWLIANYLEPTVNIQLASGIAVLLEVYICALDLADDIQDNDLTEIMQTLGTARVSLVSFTLFEAVYFALASDFLKSLSKKRQVGILQLTTTLTLRAFNGQYRDLLAQRQLQSLNKEQYLDIVREKSGSLMRLAFSLGTRCTSAGKLIERRLAAIGEIFGVIHQIANDLAGMNDPTKQDTQHKQTLPFILATEIRQKNSLLSNEEALIRGTQAARSIVYLLDQELIEQWKKVEQKYGVSSELRLLLGIDAH